MEVLLLAIMCASNIVCFIIGARVGQMVRKGEKVEIPSVSPVKAVREHEERKARKAEQERLEVILRNIEAYDGTARGQEDVPGGR